MQSIQNVTKYCIRATHILTSSRHAISIHTRGLHRLGGLSPRTGWASKIKLKIGPGWAKNLADRAGPGHVDWPAIYYKFV